MLSIGLSNGALYALIALGYTMVYGIIELINFAHGDLFMLGSVFCAIIPRGVAQPDRVLARLRGCGWRLVGIAAMGLCALINVSIEKLGLSTSAQCPQARTVDHGRRCQLHPPERRHHAQRLGAELACKRVAASRAINIGAIEIRIKYLVVIAVTIPLLLLMTYIVQQTRTSARRCGPPRKIAMRLC